MGAKESKQCTITFEEALKRVNETEQKRLREAFKRITPTATFTGNISKHVFIKDVLGEFVPTPIAERIYSTCGGTARGIAFKELLCGLVLVTRGKQEEKIKFLYDIYSNESGNFIVKSEFQKFLMETESPEIVNGIVNSLFRTSDKIDFDEFLGWIVENREATTLSRWLLMDCNSMSLNNELEMPTTFFQTLAGVTHLDEADIIELEKIYWKLKEHSKSGKLDIKTLRPLISPPIRLEMCTNLFNVFDENRDGHIDFKEMACGISAACRGPLTERQKFYFKVFDADRDGVLSDKEVNDMLDNLIFVHQENSSHKDIIDKEVLLEDIKSHKSGQSLTMEEYVMWTVHHNLSMEFLNLIFQVCHIVFGLKPVSRKEEGEIILGWAKREEKRGYQVGQFWYLIDNAWWSKWHTYVTTPIKEAFSADVQKRTCSMPYLTTSSSNVSLSNYGNSHYATQRGALLRPGAIDNSNLIIPNNSKVQTLTGEGGKLKGHVHRGQDYELIPEVAWSALERWYSSTIALPRQAIKCPLNGMVELELYPLNLKILKHQISPTLPKMGYTQSATWSSMVGGYSAASIIGSNAYSYVTNMSNSLTPKRYVAYRATFSRIATVKEVYVFLCNKLKIRPEDMRLWKYPDEDNMVVIEDEDTSLENLGVCDDDKILMEIRNKDLTWPEEIGSLANNNADKHNQKTEKGATGLNNLGNTCFMNAAVQCVSNTQPLTLYFIKDMHHYEFNRTNPLGMKGHIAKRYGDLIHDIWSGTSKTVAPLKLRWTIGKYAPRFSGYQQHDSQELLAFLLDGLHEDLNRVQDKPYLELKDSECRPDVAVAQEAWENHILRNRSIIVDLFHGQLKSKVTCKICGHESVRFDPFNYLSLPLPMESYVHVQVAVIRLNGSVPFKYCLRLNAEDKYSTVKQQLSQLTAIPSYLLQLTQVANAQIKNVLMDEEKVKGTNGSLIYAYELPVAAYSCGSMSGDEERLSISSNKSSHREAAQTFTAIQRSVRPGSQTSITNGQLVNLNEDSCESAVGNSVVSSTTTTTTAITGGGGGGDACCSESADSGLSGTDCSDILLDEMSGRLTVDSGHCSASSASLAESTDSGSANSSTPSLRPSYIVAIHRKMIRKDVYFVSWQKSIPDLFGLPVIVPCNDNTTHAELYQSVWLQVSRFVSPLPPSEATILNHALDCDDSLGYEFPFMLKAVNKEGTHCAWCPWHGFCRGCVIQCDDAEFASSSNYIAIDWDPTALHLRYQTCQETAYECVGDQCDNKQAEPIDLKECLEAFTREEHLSDDEKYYCSKCKQHQPASKKLQIWRLPPILIIHLKRFQFLHGRWVKSQKVVKFPFRDFDITDYLAALPNATVNRYKQMKHKRVKKEIEHNNYVDSTEDDDVAQMINIDEDKYTEREEYRKSMRRSCDNAASSESGVIAMDTQKRKRLESTSLSRTPIDDSSLQDFHQHKLKDNVDPFDLKYHLYSIVCHSGILGGGHYVSYACNPNGKWYCYNDSSCKEVTEEMDTDCAYMLFYEREGLDFEKYLPDISNRKKVDIMDVDTDFESDYKKMCHVM